MGPFLAALAPAALQSGLGYLSHRSAQKQREKERKEAERKAALANLVGRMGGQATGRQGRPISHQEALKSSVRKNEKRLKGKRLSLNW